MMRGTWRRPSSGVVAAALSWGALGLLTPGLLAQDTLTVDSTCTVSALNRTVIANDDGTWNLTNIPAGLGKVRVRATCVRGGTTLSGESDLFDLPPNANVTLPPIYLGSTTPIPVALQLSAPSNTLTPGAKTVQLVATASYSSGPAKDVTGAATGTGYTVSNPAVATVTADGLVTGVASGTVLIQAINEGAGGLIQIRVVLSADSDGDGIPDDVELRWGLNPNDPSDAIQDLDHDGLTNLQEYLLGTDPKNPDTDGDGLKDGDEVNKYHTNPLLADTDGDGIPDGLEVQLGTDPLDPKSVNYAGALISIGVQPRLLNMTVNSINPTASVQLTVTGTFKNNQLIDLTSKRRGTAYTSSNLNVCNFGAEDGRIYAGSAGTCTITVASNGFTATVPVSVNNFTPKAVSRVAAPGAASIDIGGGYAFIASRSLGLHVVDMRDRSNPRLITTLPLAGDPQDVRISGTYAYVAAGSAGVHVVDIGTPAAPRRIATVDTPGNAQDLSVRGGYVYLADGDSGLQIIDISSPSKPLLVGAIAVQGTAVGVDVDPVRKIAAVALANGLRLVDVSVPTAPVLKGLLSGIDITDVNVQGTTAFLSGLYSSFSAVDISDYSHPKLSSSLNPVYGGRLFDLAVAGTYAFGADYSYVVGVPVIDVSNPVLPAARFTLNIAGSYIVGTGVAADNSYVYVTDSSNLYIGQYQQLMDLAGIPPTVAIASPTPGTTLTARSTVDFEVQATDDVAVAVVSLYFNDILAGTLTDPPYLFRATIPKGINTITVRAEGVDLGANVGVSPTVSYPVIIGPLTTVVGSGTDLQGRLVQNASLQIIDEFLGVSGPDGKFTILSVPAALGRLRVYGQAVVDGVTLHARSNWTNTVPNGITDVGTMHYQLDADSDGLPDAYEQAHTCLNAKLADDDADADADGFTNMQEYQMGTDPCMPNLAPGSNEFSGARVTVYNGLPGYPVPAGRNHLSSSFLTIYNGLPGYPVEAGRSEVSSTRITVRNHDPSAPSTTPMEALSNVVTVRNTAATNVTWLNETFSPFVSVGNALPGGTLSTGMNNSLSRFVSVFNGMWSSSTMPAGFNDTESHLISVRNGAPFGIDLAAGLNERVSPLVAVRNSSTSSNASPAVRNAGPPATAAAPGTSATSLLDLSADGLIRDELIEGATYQVRLEGSLPLDVASVDFLLDGSPWSTATRTPFQATFTVPTGAGTIQTRAIVRDAAGQSLAYAIRSFSIGKPRDDTHRLRLVSPEDRRLISEAVEVRFHGLLAEYFDSAVPLTHIPDFDQLQTGLIRPVSGAAMYNPDHIFGIDPFGSGMAPDFAIRLTGSIDLVDAGEYTFSLRSMDGSRLKIDGQEVVEIPGGIGQSVSHAGRVTLAAGRHTIEIGYYATFGGPELVLQYALAGQPLRVVEPEYLTATLPGRFKTSREGIVELRLPSWMESIDLEIDGPLKRAARVAIQPVLNGALIQEVVAQPLASDPNSQLNKEKLP